MMTGTTEDHGLKNSVQDIPGTKLAFRLGRQQGRSLNATPGKKDTTASIDLVKGREQTVPIVLAATVESFE